MTADAAEELQRLSDEVAALGAQIEQKRLRALELLKGRTLETGRANRFIVDRVNVQQGGMHTFRLWAEGPRLKADGKPHARTRDMVVLRASNWGN